MMGYNVIMKIDILTIFPEMFASPFGDSIVKRAISESKVEINLHNLREWATDKHRSVDDRPFGGGAGMVMRVDIIDQAVSALKAGSSHSKVILLDTKGKFYTQQDAQKLAKAEHLIFIVGHYEGVDQRVIEHVADAVYSIGPYVLTGGELPTMVVVDSIVRLLPGVISSESLEEESYTSGPEQIEYPQYTRPAGYQGWKVPEILLGGHHAEIDSWRSGKTREKAKK
jgi:tRNA (guanine37-N1)-methyltransferase